MTTDILTVRPETPAGAATAPLLELDPGPFRARFNREPFLLRHRLAGHPLFQLPQLVELARRHQRNELPHMLLERLERCHPRGLVRRRKHRPAWPSRSWTLPVSSKRTGTAGVPRWLMISSPAWALRNRSARWRGPERPI